MGTINLDKARAARREAGGVEPEIEFGGRKFTLPAELPFDVVKTMVEIPRAKGDAEKLNDKMEAILRSLLGKQFGAFMALGPSLEDLTVLINGLMEQYGVSQGESPASAES